MEAEEIQGHAKQACARMRQESVPGILKESEAQHMRLALK